MRDANYSETIAFLSAFFRDTSEAVELRALPNGAGAPKVEFTRNPLRVVAFCQHYDNVGWGVFFGVATRDEAGRGGSREYCRELPALWTEIDLEKFGMSVADAVAILLACPLPPSVIVFSGHGLHVYWMLREPLSVTLAPFGEDAEKTRVELITRGLARVFHGDVNACDLTRILRLPGTHNSKEGAWLHCQVREASWARYELTEIEAFAALSPVLIEAAADPVTNNPPNKGNPNGEPADPDDPFASYAAAMAMDIEAELAAMALHDEAKPLHWTRMRVAGSLVARGHSDDAIFRRLMADTQRVVTEAGEAWTASREKFEAKRLSDEIRGARAKGYDKVVQLRTGTGELQNPEPQPATEPATDLAPQFLGYPLNDLGNAMRMLKLFGADIRYCLNVGWYRWDGRRFAFDHEGNRVRRQAQATAVHMRLAAAKLPSKTEAEQKANLTAFKYAIASGNKKGIDGMLAEIRTHVPVTADDLDRDTMLLNCRNGILDLRTGELRPHARDDLLSKLCGTDYDADAACPRWEQFVSEIFDGKIELIDFMQRALGYSLTGDTREEVVFILHGSGANGKTKLIETMTAVLGDYVRHSPADAWTTSATPQPSYDLAALVGARFVPVVETERNRQLAEARIKQATGGDMLPAKHLYKNPFEYQPQFKLWFATNHKPKIRGSDHAIWRRVYLIPFTVQFVDKEKADDEGGRKIKDPELIVELKKELPGILAWVVRGCLEWQRLKGLVPPEAVVVATKDYQDSEDNISAFISDRCRVRRSLSDKFGRLYAAYRLWCEENDEEAQSRKGFGLGLTDRGCAADRTGKERRRKGIDLKAEYEAEADAREEADRAKPYITAENVEESNS